MVKGCEPLYTTTQCTKQPKNQGEKEVKEQIKELALRTGFKLKEQPNGEMDLNPYVYDFAQTLLANIWVYFDDGMPTVGKVAKFMAKNGITVIGKFQAYGIGEYGVQVLDDEVWSIDMFDKWQPYEDNQDD